MDVHWVTGFIVIDPGVHSVQRGQDHHRDTEHHGKVRCETRAVGNPAPSLKGVGFSCSHSLVSNV